jgi:hypothetical protein
MKNKIRFKKEPRETGLASIGAGDPNIDIKVNGKVCGYISHPSAFSRDKNIRIRFSVVKDDINEDGNPNSVWKWITLTFLPTMMMLKSLSNPI